MTIYANAVTEIVYKYRSVFGGYKNDRNFVMASAVSNLLVSIPGAMFFGVPGVQFGTLVAFLLIAYGRNRLVIKGFFHQSTVINILVFYRDTYFQGMVRMLRKMIKR